MAQTPSSIRVDVEPLREALTDIVDTIKIVSILAEVGEAIESARAKHGKQSHLPLGYGPTERLLPALCEHSPKFLEELDNSGLEWAAKALEQDPDIQSTWATIAFEEVAEFLAARTPAEARKEALQAAAMFVSIVTIIDAADAS